MIRKSQQIADCQAESMVRYDYARNSFLIVRFARIFFFLILVQCTDLETVRDLVQVRPQVEHVDNWHVSSLPFLEQGQLIQEIN